MAISTIASFNRMKQITDDISLVVKAMKMSSMLEVGLLALLCVSPIIIFTITADIFGCSLAPFHCQEADKHIN